MSDQMSQADREKRLSQAYNRASQVLRERYRAEFQQLYGEHAAALGVEWKPRLSAEEKAEQELLTIFDAHPELRIKYAPTPEDLNPPIEEAAVEG